LLFYDADNEFLCERPLERVSKTGLIQGPTKTERRIATL
jgi:hypothetical protein